MFQAWVFGLLGGLRHRKNRNKGAAFEALLERHLAFDNGAPLRQLQQQGLVRCRHLPSGEALFAPTERDEHHLTCVDCGRTQPLTACPIHDAHLSPEQIGGFQLLFHTLEFFGLCSDCQGRQDQG